jgi:predicted ribosomally synthesized peptide with SipW-like signal peptide
MDEKVEGTLDTTRPRGLRSQKVRALMAGGLVLGVGAAITLAAWNDSEFAQGSFGTGAFNMVGSTDGTTYTDHATVGAPATLAFTLNPTLLAPGDVVYAPFAVRLDAATTNAAVVTISNAASSGTVTDRGQRLFRPAPRSTPCLTQRRLTWPRARLPQRRAHRCSCASR